MRPFLFLAGEYKVTMPIVFEREHWGHSMTPVPFHYTNNKIHRYNKEENLEGVLLYASIYNDSLKYKILNFLKESNLPCWPEPNKIIEYSDRQSLLKFCYDNGFIDHDIEFVDENSILELEFPYPYVLKTGNLHQGQGKYLISSMNDIENLKFEGIASVEPYVEGISCRVLLIEDDAFGIQFDNSKSWIKNSAGAEVTIWNSIPKNLEYHARLVQKVLNLEIVGVDYILKENPTGLYPDFAFLEANMFPGVNSSDQIAERAKTFFKQKMDEIERKAQYGTINCGW